MEPEQAGAVESPDSLLSNRSVPGLHGLHGLCARFARFMPGLHGLCSGRKRRGTPTRRKRVEQERPLLWSAFSSLLLPGSLALPPSQHPNKRGPMAPWWAQQTETVTPGRPWNLRAKANAFSAGISRIFLTGLPRLPKCSTVQGTAPLFLIPGA